jgi:hypothetical protein
MTHLPQPARLDRHHDSAAIVRPCEQQKLVGGRLVEAIYEVIHAELVADLLRGGMVWRFRV